MFLKYLSDVWKDKQEEYAKQFGKDWNSRRDPDIQPRCLHFILQTELQNKILRVSGGMEPRSYDRTNEKNLEYQMYLKSK